MSVFCGNTHSILVLMMYFMNVNVDGTPMKNPVSPVIDHVLGIHAKYHIQSKGLPVRYIFRCESKWHLIAIDSHPQTLH